MSRRLKQTVGVVIVVFAAAQLIRPGRANPATDAAGTIQAQFGSTSELVPVLNRACGDCHSNETVWPWYTQVAPLSWVMAYGVREGRKVVNFSEWTAYPPERQRMLLVASCRAAAAGRMPGTPYTLLHPRARLSARDVEAICAAGLDGARSSSRGFSR